MTTDKQHSEFEKIRKSLIAKRVEVRADTPSGRRLSMVLEQMANGVDPLPTLHEIEQIQRDGGQYVHSNHGAGR